MARPKVQGPALLAIFDRLAAAYGELHWWPAESPFEVAVGAILTQNTAWSNVEQAIAALKSAGVLSCAGLSGLAAEELQGLIRPAGFFRQKAQRLKGLAAYLERYHAGSLEQMLGRELAVVRRELLALDGIGPETADAILLYAGEHPSFVVDAYTRRLFARLDLLGGSESYETIRSGFMEVLPPSPPLFNAYHALIVEHSKQHCRKLRPRCQNCPLLSACPARRKDSAS